MVPPKQHVGASAPLIAVRAACFAVRYPAVRPLFILLFVLLAGVACRGDGGGTTVATEVVMIGDTEMVVTRLVRQTVAVPVTVTPDPGQVDARPVVLDISYPGEPGQLDPQTVSAETGVTLVENLFAGLTRYDHASNSVMPELAESWEVSADGRTWTFHLRDDVFWMRSALQQQALPFAQRRPEPYRPVTAGDMVTAVRRLCSEVQSPDVFIFFIIEGCENVHVMLEPTAADLAAVGARAEDDTTLVISLTKPASYFLTMTSMWLFRPVPGDIITFFQEEEFEPWATVENVITSGPFLIGGETVSGTRLVLERNPYWPVPFAGNVDRVNIYWLDAESAFELWVDRELDVMPLPAGMRAEVEANSALRSRLHLVTRQRVFYLAYNFDSQVFREATVRRAFGAAIDREALILDVYGGSAAGMRHFSPPGVVGAPPIDVVGNGFNEDMARIEMANSPFRDCRFMPPVRFLVGATDLDLFHAEMLRSMWMDVLSCQEETIAIEQVQFGTLLADTRPDAGERRPDIWSLGWASYFPDAHNWLSDVLHCQDSENRLRRPCSEADDLIRQAGTEQDIEARWDLYRQAERLFFGEGGIEPVTPLLVQGEFYMIQSWLTYAPAHFGGEQFDTYLLDAAVKELEQQQ